MSSKSFVNLYHTYLCKLILMEDRLFRHTQIFRKVLSTLSFFFSLSLRCVPGNSLKCISSRAMYLIFFFSRVSQWDVAHKLGHFGWPEHHEDQLVSSYLCYDYKCLSLCLALYMGTGVSWGPPSFMSISLPIDPFFPAPGDDIREKHSRSWWYESLIQPLSKLGEKNIKTKPSWEF